MTFKDFLNKCSETIYPEIEGGVHKQLIPIAVNHACSFLKPDSKVVDIGIGTLQAMNVFRDKGHRVFGVSVSEKEIQTAKESGFQCGLMDMHDIQELIADYECVFARHVLEHSPCPLFVLNQIHSILKLDGIVYIEVPMPGTSCLHELNPNHYSVLGKLSWLQLISRAGFEVFSHNSFAPIVGTGPDEYAAFLCRKKTEMKNE